MGIRVYPTRPGPFDSHPVTVWTDHTQAYWRCACGATGPARSIAAAYDAHAGHKLDAIEAADEAQELARCQVLV